MKIENPSILIKYRGPGLCELCRASCQRREPHHIIHRGMNGGRTLDIDLNLVALGSAFDCGCHDSYHRSAYIHTEDFWRIVARREKLVAGDIEAALHCVVRLSQLPLSNEITAAIEELDPWAGDLVRKVLREEFKRREG